MSQSFRLCPRRPAGHRVRRFGETDQRHGYRHPPTEVWCMATAVLALSRAASYRGQVAVGQVDHEPRAPQASIRDICGVVCRTRAGASLPVLLRLRRRPAGVTRNDQAGAIDLCRSPERDLRREYIADVSCSTLYHATIYPRGRRMKKNTKIGMRLLPVQARLEVRLIPPPTGRDGCWPRSGNRRWRSSAHARA